MAEEEATRRLATIIVADIVGYSRMMSVDEAATLARMRAHRLELVDPAITEHGGRIVKGTGDGFIAEFGSPVEAVRAAIVIQQGMARRNLAVEPGEQVVFRIGVNLGDVIVEHDDLFGDAVNVAARLENICEPGAVYISGVVYEIVKHKLVVGYHALGDQRLKNITDPVRVYRVLADPTAVSEVRRKLRRPRLWIGAGVAAAAVIAAVLAVLVLPRALNRGAPQIQATAPAPPASAPAARPPQAALPQSQGQPGKTVAQWAQIKTGVRVFPSSGGYLEVTKVAPEFFTTTTDTGREFIRYGGFIVFPASRVDDYKFNRSAAMNLWPLTLGGVVELVITNRDETARWVRRVEVKAGDIVRVGDQTVDALLVEVSNHALTHRFNGIYRYWFAPAVGMFVKYECLLDPECVPPWTANYVTRPTVQ